jgi:hypothetical protein
MGRWSEIERGATPARRRAGRAPDFAPQNAARRGRPRPGRAPENPRFPETFRPIQRILTVVEQP